MLPDGGQMQPTAHLFRTDNDGGLWTESPLAGVQYGSTPIVLVTQSIRVTRISCTWCRSVQTHQAAIACIDRPTAA